MEGSRLTEVARQREDRLLALQESVVAAQVQADALEALVDLIANAHVPVLRYEEHWSAVEARLRKDAAIARKRVTLARERVADVQHSIEARERWAPGRREELSST